MGAPPIDHKVGLMMQCPQRKEVIVQMLPKDRGHFLFRHGSAGQPGCDDDFRGFNEDSDGDGPVPAERVGVCSGDDVTLVTRKHLASCPIRNRSSLADALSREGPIRPGRIANVAGVENAKMIE